MNRCGKLDLHMHTTISDGTDSPQTLLDNIRAAGIGVFSVTDHDAMKAAQIIPGLCGQDDPAFIPGIEFSCRDAQGKYHILGYGFDPAAASMCDLVEYGHSLRVQKVRARVEHLQNEFGFSFPQEELDALFVLDNPGKPHIGNLMVRHGYAQSITDAINNYIDRLHYRGSHVTPDKAIEGVLAAGGIPVLAHPLFGSGSEHICGEEMEQRLRRLLDYGLQGVEAFYSGFSAQQQEEVLALAKKYDLFVTAGSDYHGANKPIRLGQTGLDGTDAYPEGLKRFLDVFGV